MRFAVDLRIGSQVPAGKVGARTPVASLLCRECAGQVVHVRAGGGRAAHFRHSVPAKDAPRPCSLRVLDEGLSDAEYARAAERAFGTLSEPAQIPLLDALVRHLDLLLAERPLDAGDRARVEELRADPAPLLACADPTDWVAEIEARIADARTLPSRRHAALLRHLLSHADATDEKAYGAFLTMLVAGWVLSSRQSVALLQQVHRSGRDALRSWFQDGPGDGDQPVDVVLLATFGLSAGEAGTRASFLRALAVRGVLRVTALVDIDRLLVDPGRVRSGMGWVYLAERHLDGNAGTDGERGMLLKIGLTRRAPEVRVAEHAASLPDGTWACLDSELVENPVATEQALIQAFGPYRGQLGLREFFRAPHDTALQLFRRVITRHARLPAAETATRKTETPSAPQDGVTVVSAEQGARRKKQRPAPRAGYRVPLRRLSVPRSGDPEIPAGLARHIEQLFEKDALEDALYDAPGLAEAARWPSVPDTRRAQVESHVAAWLVSNLLKTDRGTIERLLSRSDARTRLPWELLIAHPSHCRLTDWAVRAVWNETERKRAKRHARKTVGSKSV